MSEASATDGNGQSLRIVKRGLWHDWRSYATVPGGISRRRCQTVKKGFPSPSCCRRGSRRKQCSLWGFQAAARMNEMIGDLLDYSRLAREQIDIAPVALGEVVAAAQQQLAEDLTARQAEITVAAALPTVLGHQATLVQVVANLLTNAAKFVAPERPAAHRGGRRRAPGDGAILDQG